MGYEPVAKARFTIEPSGAGELIRVRAARQWWPLLFLPVWLAGWTAGGVAAIYSLFTDFEPFVVLWLCAWALGWLAVAMSLAWMIAGSETVRVVGSDLEVAHHVFGFSRRWLYEGSRIRNLRLAEQSASPFRNQLPVPFLKLTQSGLLKFDYGPRTIQALNGLDEAEGELILDRLRPRLPVQRDGAR